MKSKRQLRDEIRKRRVKATRREILWNRLSGEDHQIIRNIVTKHKRQIKAAKIYRVSGWRRWLTK